MAPAVATDQMAIWSLVLAGVGLLGICCFGVGGLILGPIAFFVGNSSLKRIRASGGSVGGDTMANIGRIGGIVVAIIGALVLLTYIGLAVSGSFNNTTTH